MLKIITDLNVVLCTHVSFGSTLYELACKVGVMLACCGISVSKGLISAPHLLHFSHCHLDKAGRTVSLQPLLLGAKLKDMQVNAPLMSWLMDYLMGRPQSYTRDTHEAEVLQ